MLRSTLAPGERFGRYELVRQRGGTTGNVWEAVLHGPEGLRRSVALDLLPSGPGDPGSQATFAREARLGAILHHPNVVGIYDVGEVDGQRFVAMELVRGASLAELLAGGVLPPNVVVEVGLQVCAGLVHLHGAGLVHRAIQPSNLLVDTSGHVKILDLGAWRLSDEAGYTSPEPAELGSPDPRSDLFSLGATLYVLSTGQPPVGSASGLDPVESAVPGLAEIVRRCLCPDPADRWASAAELGVALGALRSRQVPGPGLRETLFRVRPELADLIAGSATSTPRESPNGNLPNTRDDFVGRARERAELSQAAVAGPRLTSLLGLGGSGKTRLALEVARLAEPALAGGAWFFDLSEARTAHGLCFAVARELALQLEANDPVGQVGRALGARGEALFVLDHLEQASAESAVVERWVTLAPRARFLCTSRVALRLPDEHRVPLGPLTRDDGVALFRARAAREVPLDEVRALVTAVEGSPLAIELLASHSRSLTGEQLLHRLKLRLLSRQASDETDRHRSLSATLDGSFELLTPAAAAALAQLSVFDGGFDLGGAGAVVTGSWVVGLLEELVDASLLRVDPSGRFGMPVLVQAYAAGRLSSDERAAAEIRHGRYFAQLGSREALAALSGFGGVERRQAVAREQDNLLTACRRAVERGDGDTAVNTALAASEVFETRGPLATSAAVLKEVLPLASGPRRSAVEARLGLVLHLLGDSEAARVVLEKGITRVRALLERRSEGDLLVTLGDLHREQGQMEQARLHLASALGVQREVGDRRSEAKTLGALGSLSLEQGRTEQARTHFTDALALFREQGNRAAEGKTLGNLGLLHMEQGRTDEARVALEGALAVHREVGARRSEALTLGNLGNLHLEQGRHAEAQLHFEAALAAHREVGNRRSEGSALSNLGTLYLEQGRLDEARLQFEGALTVHREVGNRRSEGIAWLNLGQLHLDEGDIDAARRSLEAAEAAARTVRHPRLLGSVLALVAELRRRTSDGAASLAALTEGERLLRGVGDRVALAALLQTRARLQCDQGALPEARATLAELERLAEETGAKPESALGRGVAALRAALR